MKTFIRIATDGQVTGTLSLNPESSALLWQCLGEKPAQVQFNRLAALHEEICSAECAAVVRWLPLALVSPQGQVLGFLELSVGGCLRWKATGCPRTYALPPWMLAAFNKVLEKLGTKQSAFNYVSSQVQAAIAENDSATPADRAGMFLVSGSKSNGTSAFPRASGDGLNESAT